MGDDMDEIQDMRLDSISGEIQSIKSRQDKQEQKIMETERDVASLKSAINHLEDRIMMKFEHINETLNSIDKNSRDFKEMVYGFAGKLFWSVVSVVVSAVVLWLLGGGLNVSI